MSPETTAKKTIRRHAKDSTAKKPRRAAKDIATETFGIRGAGGTSQADFGQPISNADLIFAVKREPVANRVVFRVAHDIFDNWFEAVEVAKEGQKPDPEFNKKVQTALSLLNAKTVFTQAAAFERLFGWSIIIIGFVDHGKSLQDEVEEPQEIRDLEVYSPLEVSVQSSDEEKDPNSPRFGLPILYTVNRGSGVQQEKVHFSRVIHLATRLLDHPYKGLSILEAIYDDLTVWRNIRWGMGQTMFRYGSGFPDIELEGANKPQIDAFIASKQMEGVNARTYFVHSEKQRLEFKGLEGRALDPESYCKNIMESLSTGTNIPTAILRGAQAGALTGSEVNEREYFKIISDEQSLYEPAIWQLIDLLIETGQIPEVEDYEIKWLGGFEINEVDKSVADLNRARAEDLRSKFLTVNELRARMTPALSALPEPQGSVIPGLLQREQPGFPSPSQSSKHNGEENEKDRDSTG